MTSLAYSADFSLRCPCVPTHNSASRAATLIYFQEPVIPHDFYHPVRALSYAYGSLSDFLFSSVMHWVCNTSLEVTPY